MNSIIHRAPSNTEDLDTISEVPEDDQALVSRPRDLTRGKLTDGIKDSEAAAGASWKLISLPLQTENPGMREG